MRNLNKYVLAGFLVLIGLACLYVRAFDSTRNVDVRHDRYRLVWMEDFNGTGLDYSRWSKIKRAYQAPWLKYMSSDSSLYSVEKGRLRLYARENMNIDPNDTARILTGGVSTENKVTVKYGKVEVKARVKGAEGAWPAIWLLANDRRYRTYPIYAEIDFMEHYNQDDFVWQTVHNNYTDILGFKDKPKYQVKTPIDSGKYNVYGVEILPEMIVLSVNGKETMKYPNLHKDKEHQYPYGCEKYLMIDMQVGNKWLKHVDLAHFPCYIDVDWVKVYVLAGSQR